MSVIETVKVTYQEVVQAMAEYYGTEQFLKIAGAGATVEQFLNALKAVPNYNAIVSASGKIIGYEKAITTTISTAGSATSSTATATVATTTAFGATATESGVVATGVGQTTAGTAGSFIFGEVLPAVGAVAVGTVLGVGVDSLIYQSNPDYWDEVLPTINPQTWDDIILGHDTKIPLLHNTQDGKSYISEEAFAYATKAYLNAGVFSASEYIEKSDNAYSDVKIYPHKGGFSFKNSSVDDSLQAQTIINEVNAPSVNDIYFFASPKYRTTAEGHIASDLYIVTNNTANLRRTELVMQKYNVSDQLVTVTRNINFSGVSHNGKSYYYNMLSSTAVENPGIVDSSYNPSNVTINELLYVLFDGNIENLKSDIPDGYFKIGGALFPSGLDESASMNEIKEKLKLSYPDLYNNAISYTTLSPDGENVTNLWLPVQLPQNSYEPTSLNNTQTFDGTYPNEETKTETIENVVTPAINAGIASGTPDNDNSTGEEDTPPIIAPITPVQTGLGAVYIPTLEQLRSFSAWLWSSDIVEQVKRLFANPMDGIIGLHQVFFTPTANGSEKIQTGYLTSTVDSSYTTTRYYTIDCGEIALKEKSGNVFDYSPYTSVELYLPFIGIVPLDVGAVMRSTIHVSYECDVITGACLANVEIARDGNTNVLYSFGGSCALQYPLSSGSYVGILGAIAGIAVNVGTAIATGGATLPLNIGGIASSIAGAKTSVASSGGYSGNTGAMGIKKPYLIIKRSFKAMPRNYSKYIGNPLGNTKTLNELSGYTECEVVHISGNMTTEEKNEIETILKNGVII